MPPWKLFFQFPSLIDTPSFKCLNHVQMLNFTRSSLKLATDFKILVVTRPGLSTQIERIIVSQTGLAIKGIRWHARTHTENV